MEDKEYIFIPNLSSTTKIGFWSLSSLISIFVFTMLVIRFRLYSLLIVTAILIIVNIELVNESGTILSFIFKALNHIFKTRLFLRKEKK